MDVARCFLAFFVPPLAVYLQEGFSRRHWWTLLLTLCGFVPGVALALYAVFQHVAQPPPNPLLDAAVAASRHRSAPPG
jgi:uncharacterized membrane protein YqaE (UPF0057 family)